MARTFNAPEVASMFERDCFSSLDISMSSSSVDEVFDLSDPKAIEVHLSHHLDELNLREQEAIEDLGRELDEATMSDHQEIDKTMMTRDKELDVVMVSSQSNDEESQSFNLDDKKKNEYSETEEEEHLSDTDR